jgi:hypothetical protein
MEIDTRTLVKEVLNHYRTITDVDALTTLQRQEHAGATRLALGARGITYTLRYAEDCWDDSSLSLVMPNVEIVDVGTVRDVHATGPSPIRLGVGDNIEILYEPRNLDKLTNPEARKNLSNSEFLHLAKGSDYRFHGTLEGCCYYFKRARESAPEFSFHIVGRDESAVVNGIDNDNIRKATRSGVVGGLFGAGAGFVLGIAACLALALVILPIYSWSEYGLGSPKDDTPWPTFVIVISTAIGAILGYRVDYSSTRGELVRKD